MKERLKTAVQAILNAYKDEPIEKDHCSCSLPSNDALVKIIDETRELMFPGYFSKTNVSVYGDRRKTKRHVRRLERLLKKQISYALLYLADEEKNKLITKHSCQLCVRFIERIPDIRSDVRKDVDAHLENDPAAFNRDQVIVSYPGLYAIMVYRIAHTLLDLGVPLIPRMMAEHAHRETGIDINPGAAIGASFFIDHGTGVVIGETAVIGDRVKIYQGVTLGALSLKGGRRLKGKQRHPTIGDDVTIYAGASILGGETTIGSRSTIGSNVFITSSVPEDAKVLNRIHDHEIRQKDKRNGESS
jgi:serine O-acetyltransferase